jgi:hypothetical protein
MAGKEIGNLPEKPRPTREEMLERLRSREPIEVRESVVEAVAAERRRLDKRRERLLPLGAKIGDLGDGPSRR